MAIKQLEDGSYLVRQSTRHSVTKQPISIRRKCFTGLKDAQKLEKRLKSELTKRMVETRSPKWGDILPPYEDFLRIQKGLEEKTISNYLSSLRRHTLPEWAHKRVDQISAYEIRDLISRQLARKSVAHQKNLYKFIKSVFMYAIERRHIGADPMPTMNFKVEQKMKRCLNRNQAEFFLREARAVNHKWYPIWLTAIYTGMRSGELYALKWENVDFNGKRILVKESWDQVNGEKCTKAGYERFVTMSDDLLDFFKEYRMRSDPKARYVFHHHRDWTKGEQARLLKLFLITIGLPPIKFHDLRATWCTLLLDAGTESTKVMKMGGWRDIKTMGIYLRSAGISLAGATDSLIGLMGASTSYDKTEGLRLAH